MAFDVATLGIAIDARPVTQGAAELDKLTAAGARAEGAAMKVGRASKASATDLAGLGRAGKTTATDLAGLTNQIDALNAKMAIAQSKSLAPMISLHTRGAAAARLHGHEMLNLSRQFADIGVTAAMGMNPLMILIQQGPQIGETIGAVSHRAGGLAGALRLVAVAAWAAVAPFAPFLAVATAVAALFGGALALGARAVNRDIDALGASLDLTAAQLDLVKEKGVTMGDGLKAVFQVLGGYIWDAVGPAFKRIGVVADDALDLITKGAMWAAKTYVGAWLGTFNVLKTVWGRFPEVMGDVAISAVNLTIRAVEIMINRVIARINAVKDFANAAAKAVGLGTPFGDLKDVDFAEVANPYRDAARALPGELAKAWGSGFDTADGMVDRFADDWARQTLRNAVDRLEEETKAAKPRITKAAEDAAAAFQIAPFSPLVLDTTWGARATLAPQTLDLAALKDDGAKAFSAGIDEARERMANGFRYAFSDGIRAALNGDLKGFLKSTFDRALGSALDKLMQTAIQVGPGGKLSFGGVGGFKLGNMSTTGSLLATGAMAAGSAIGGVGGGILSGAGTGAMIGSVIPGIGTAIGAGIGAVIGGIGGLLGGSSKRKREAEAARQKAIEEAEQARLAELQRQQDIATTKRGLEIQLMEAANDNVGALAARRHDEIEALRALDPALGDLAMQLHAAQDAATAAAKAEEDRAKALDIDRATYAAATERVAEAQERLNSVYAASVAEITATRDKFTGLRDTLRDVRIGLDAQIGGQGALDALFKSTAASARLGDADAMARLAQLAPQQVEALRSSARTDLEALRATAQVRNAVQAAEDTASRQVSIAEQQLQALEAAGRGWVTLNETTATGLAAVQAEIINLSAAFGLKAAAQPGATGFYGVPQNEAVNKALERATGYNGGFGSGGFQDYITGAGAAYQQQARDILNAYGQTNRIVGFATGGSFEVGGSGGPDSQHFGLALSPGEMVNIRRPGEGGGDNGELVEALGRLEARLARIEANTAEGARGSTRTEERLRDMSSDGTALNVRTAA